ncbi:hypothetical protein CHELA1G11_30087 [Hyphomicrobiales bacterium]|nr:hypothetical protein CHELA1G2_30133 [Hyphomicrobiales bacterium]CAH1696192.1 hypothetical protein CHELA1G11_30087 [Hyphomicrobiales bacterium]
MLTQTVLNIVFISHMSVATAFPWFALQSVFLRKSFLSPEAIWGRADPGAQRNVFPDAG